MAILMPYVFLQESRSRGEHKKGYAACCKGGSGDLPRENFVIMEACGSYCNALLSLLLLRKLCLFYKQYFYFKY